MPCPKNRQKLCASLVPFARDAALDIISFSPRQADVPLEEVQCKIVDHLRVVDSWEVLLGEVRQAVACRPSRRLVIDLIAHATSAERVLRFGVMQMTEAVSIQAFATLAPLAARIAKIRLIGCQTGISPAGYQALRALQQAMGGGVEVYGTISDVNVNSFSDSQYTSGYLQSATQPFVPQPAAMPPAAPARLIEKPAHHQFRELLGAAASAPLAPGSARNADSLTALLACVDESSARLSPGLLLEPSWSGVAQDGRRVDALRGWSTLRIWNRACSEGVLFDVSDSQQLESAVASAHFTVASGAPSFDETQRAPR
jgi:hypothetical protein